MATPIIGIDLGTTNSCAAVANDSGQVTLIPYRGGEYIIPSMFAVDDKGRELLGYDAKRQWQLNPKKTIFGAKRLAGLSYDSPIVEQMSKRVGYGIARGPNDEVVLQVGQRTLDVATLFAKTLDMIRNVASEHLGTRIEQAVVTVPAYFNDRQRQVVREAGKLAKLDIVRIINEPTAAALAYGFRRGLNKTVAVYDLGGGTFDVSVIEVRDRVYEVKATGGDVFLGGLDFDNALIQYVLVEFAAKHGVDLKEDPVAMQRLRDMAERTKVDLSTRTQAPFMIPFIAMSKEGKPLDVEMTITRDELTELVSPLVEKTFETVANVIDAAGLAPDTIDEVLLVGGQTRMPHVQKALQIFFGKEPAKSVHPDEAVAIGAALYAWSLSDRSDLKIQLLDVLPMAIGIERANGEIHRLFEHNCAVPNQRAFTFTTHRDNQKDLVMRIFQGDSMIAKDNTLLGKFTFSGIRPGPAGSVRVEVIFDVSSEGILSLSAKDLDTGAAMAKKVHFNQDA